MVAVAVNQQHGFAYFHADFAARSGVDRDGQQLDLRNFPPSLDNLLKHG